MDAGLEVSGGDAPVDAARAARFRRPARWVIFGFLVAFTAGTFAYRAFWPEDPSAQYAGILGETFANVFLYFGPPQRENDDGRGGRVVHYKEYIVVGDHFEQREFRIFMNADGRVYKFERD